MSRFRTVAAGALLLFGTTFLWFMPSFLGTATTVGGAIWSVIQFLVLATVAGYAGAAWGLYKATSWWRPLAIGGSALGTLVLMLWWLMVSSVSGVTNMVANLALHAIGIAVLLLILLLAVYWRLVRPWTMRWGATTREAARLLPGDRSMTRPGFRRPGRSPSPLVPSTSGPGWSSWAAAGPAGTPSTGSTTPGCPAPRQFVLSFRTCRWVT